MFSGGNDEEMPPPQTRYTFWHNTARIMEDLEHLLEQDLKPILFIQIEKRNYI